MYDKTVRRRRVVLGLLVASSLILLTAYFGESAGGGLHSVQRGVLEVVSPIQEGASKALKPVRDLFGWAGDTFHAKGELKDVRKDRDALRAQNIQLQAKLREQAQLERPARPQRPARPGGQPAGRPRTSSARTPTCGSRRSRSTRARPSGVNVNQAVVNGAGARRQGHLGVARDVDRHARHRPHDADRRDGERERGQGDRAGRGRPPDRPRARLAVGQGRRAAGRDRRHLGHGVEGRQVPLALSPRHPDRARDARRRRRAATTSRSTSRRSSTGAASTSSRC